MLTWTGEKRQTLEIFTEVIQIRMNKAEVEIGNRKPFTVCLPNKIDLFPHRTLVIGEPGIGKTTLCNNICLEWAENKEGNPFNMFLLLFMIPLRRLENPVTSIVELIEEAGLIARDEFSQIEKDMFDNYILNHPNDVCLILDGFDELDKSLQENVLDIWNGKEKRNVSIVMTSRPEFMDKLENGATDGHCYELAGFDEMKKISYIRAYFEDYGNDEQASTILAKEGTPSSFVTTAIELLITAASPTVQALTRNPLNLALMCMLLEDNNGMMPQTKTDIIQETVLCSVKRAEKYLNPDDILDVTSIDDLPYQVKSRFMNLAKFAFDGIALKIFTFPTKEVEKRSFNCQEHHFGLMTSRKCTSFRQPGREWYFLLASFQEFLAAYYFSKNITEHMLQSNSFGSENVSNNMQIFYCGILSEMAVPVLKSKILSKKHHMLDIEWLLMFQEALQNCDSSTKSTFQEHICDELSSIPNISINLVDAKQHVIAILSYFVINTINHIFWKKMKQVTISLQDDSRLAQTVTDLETATANSNESSSVYLASVKALVFATRWNHVCQVIKVDTLKRSISLSTHWLKESAQCGVSYDDMQDLLLVPVLQDVYSIYINIGIEPMKICKHGCISTLTLPKSLKYLQIHVNRVDILSCSLDSSQCQDKPSLRYITTTPHLEVLGLATSQQMFQGHLQIPSLSLQTFHTHANLKYLLLYNCIKEDLEVLESVVTQGSMKCLILQPHSSTLLKVNTIVSFLEHLPLCAVALYNSETDRNIYFDIVKAIENNLDNNCDIKHFKKKVSLSTFVDIYQAICEKKASGMSDEKCLTGLVSTGPLSIKCESDGGPLTLYVWHHLKDNPDWLGCKPNAQGNLNKMGSRLKHKMNIEIYGSRQKEHINQKKLIKVIENDVEDDSIEVDLKQIDCVDGSEEVDCGCLTWLCTTSAMNRPHIRYNHAETKEKH